MLDGVVPLSRISKTGFVAVMCLDMAAKVGWRHGIAAAETDKDTIFW
jgi:hypothetical protein